MRFSLNHAQGHINTALNYVQEELSDVHMGDAREEQRGAALLAAARLIEGGGLKALTARRLAAEIGCSVGSLYNLFESTDAIVARLNLETLCGLDVALAAASVDGTPEVQVAAFAEAYLDYTLSHRARWAAVLDFAPGAPHHELEAAVVPLVARLDRALSPLCRDPAERQLAAAVLWTSIEGIVALGIAGHAARLSPAEPRTLVRCLVETFLAGLAQR